MIKPAISPGPTGKKKQPTGRLVRIETDKTIRSKGTVRTRQAEKHTVK